MKTKEQLNIEYTDLCAQLGQAQYQLHHALPELHHALPELITYLHSRIALVLAESTRIANQSAPEAPNAN